MQAPLQRDRASSTLPHVQKALEATADQEALYTITISQGNGERRGGSTDDVDEDGNKDGGSYGSSVFGVINTPDEFLVAILVNKSQDRQDYDREYREDETALGSDHVAPVVFPRGGGSYDEPRPSLKGSDDGLHGGRGWTPVREDSRSWT